MSGSPDEFHIRSEAEYEDALSRFPYPLTIVPGDQALEEYERLKREGVGTPVIVGGASELVLTLEVYESSLPFEPSAGILLERASELVFPEHHRWVVAQKIEALLQLQPRLRVTGRDLTVQRIGDWPDCQIGESFEVTAAYDAGSGQPWPRVHTAVLPTQNPTEAPAYLRSGGWNDMPESATLVSALRRWRERHGAELISLSYDSMDIRVQRTATSRDEAIELAREHFLFCPDVLGDVTLHELAAHLIENDWWFFWWD